MTGVDRRGEVASGLGGLLTVLAASLLAWLAVWTGSDALWAAAFQTAGVIGIWFLCWIQVHQLRLIAEERLEVAELERQRTEKLGGVQTIFQEEELDQMEKLAMGRRLRSIEKFLVPVVALLIAGLHVLGGLVLFKVVKFGPLTDEIATDLSASRPAAFFALGIAFGLFMFSRYAMGMSRLHDWATLRAGGNYLFGAATANLAVFVVLLCAMSGMGHFEDYLVKIVAALLLLLAVEVVVNFVLDFYRPRVAGEAQRPFYDSRFLGMFSEPGGILNSLAKAVDYQFGFKVSETWFYKLLGKAVLPLLLVQVAVIFALTTIVVVPPGHQAVIEHYGKPTEATAGPGLHFTWPWPIDQVVMIPVERVQRIEVGFVSDARDAEKHLGDPILWTEKHYAKEYMLLVGDKHASKSAELPLNLLSMNMPVQWRVKDGAADVLRYYKQSADVASLIESIAYRELTRYAAEADLKDLLGDGGLKAAADLWQRIQTACDHAGDDGSGLGVQIVHLGIGGIHPPSDQQCASSFEEVVNAVEQRNTAILKAEGEAARTRIDAAGTQYVELYAAILAEDEARKANDPKLAEKTAVVEDMLRRVVGGQARQEVGNAAQETYQRVSREHASAEQFSVELIAYKAAPQIFLLRSYLQVLETGLSGARKFIVTVPNLDNMLYNLDVKPKSALDVLGAELRAADQSNGK